MVGRFIAGAAAGALLLTGVLAASPVPTIGAGAAPAAVVAGSGQDRVVVKFRAGAKVRLRRKALVSLTGADTHGMAAALASAGGPPPARLFMQDEAALDRDRAVIERRSGEALPDLNSWFTLTTAPGLGGALAEVLRRLPIVETAYVAPPPAPPPAGATRMFVSAQGYRAAAPDGIGTASAAAFPGATGAGVRIVDVEYGWNRTHEDLGKAAPAGALIANGTPVNPFPDDNHGTAVLGELVGTADDRGVTGLVPDADLALVNAWDAEAGSVLANGINLARQRMSAGDVLLVEQQSPGLVSGRYLPAEWDPAVYDAIRVATAAGIVVVEPAGNGSVDLDDPAYGAPFPQGKPDSGALIVGAGAAGACHQWPGPARSRLDLSNYGSRVDLQGWGECVTSTGFGDLTAGAADPDTWYTAWFSGTSSAAAMVAAAAAAVEGANRALNGGAVLSPGEVRDLLVRTGTPQDTTSPDAASGGIGPLPDLGRALPLVDVTAPTAPAGLRVALGPDGHPLLSWTPATDPLLAGHEVLRNGTLLAATAAGEPARYDDQTAVPGVTYTYVVRGVDQAGNRSDPSGEATIAVPAPVDEPTPVPAPVQPPPAPTPAPVSPVSVGAEQPLPGATPAVAPPVLEPAAAPAAPQVLPAAVVDPLAAAVVPPAAVAPTLRALRAVPARIVVRRARRAPATLRFSLTAPARVWLTVTARPRREPARVAARIRVDGRAGANAIAVRLRRLPAGAYAIAVRVAKGPATTA